MLRNILVAVVVVIAGIVASFTAVAGWLAFRKRGDE